MARPANRRKYPAVALLAEGVDRNTPLRGAVGPCRASPSSRRAWIEILCWKMSTTAALVALLAEGVDRNWKECGKKKMWLVALLAEGVDRNIACHPYLLWFSRRPPRGGRG